MNLRKITKITANILVGLGAYSITREVIDNNTDEPETRSKAVLNYAGSAAIAGLVTDAASEHTDRGVDELFDVIEKYTNRTS